MKKGITFTIEVLLLLAALLASGALLARTYGAARTMSVSAQQLNTAVRLAQNTAELFAAGKVQPSQDAIACYDKQRNELSFTDENVAYAVYLVSSGEPENGVQRVRIIVTDSYDVGAKELYRLETAKYSARP